MAESGVESIRMAAFTEVGILKLQWSRLSSNKDLAAKERRLRRKKLN